MGCLTLAAQLCSGSSADAEEVIKISKTLEAYCWGGFAPIENAPHPVRTIEGAATEVLKQLTELTQNIEDTKRRQKMNAAVPHFNRFMAELRNAWGEELPGEQPVMREIPEQAA